MNPKEIGLLSQLVRWIWDTHEHPWDYNNPDAATLYSLLQGAYPSFENDGRLENALPSPERSRSGFEEIHRFLYLRPLELTDTLVPVVTMRWDFDRSFPEFRVQVLLFLLRANNVKSIGFRFETPEGEGRHHFFHAQMIRAFRGSEPLGCPEWLPTQEPTVCLDAKNPVQLLIAVLVSLYGWRYLDRPLTAKFKNDLAPHVGEMHLLHLKPSYWRVTSRNTGCYKTWTKDKRFKLKMKAKLPGCTIDRITEDEYITAQIRLVD